MRLWTLPPGYRDTFGMLAGAFGWAPVVIYGIPLDELPGWIDQAKKWGFEGRLNGK